LFDGENLACFRDHLEIYPSSNCGVSLAHIELVVRQ
jgi:hypothetical protein